MADESAFKCMRCGHEFNAPYEKGVLTERSCPKCGSNSIRHIGEKK